MYEIVYPWCVIPSEITLYSYMNQQIDTRNEIVFCIVGFRYVWLITSAAVNVTA